MRAQTYPTAVPTIHSHAILPMPWGVVMHHFYLTFKNFLVGKGVLCRRTCGALLDLKKTPNLQMWYFSISFSYPQVSPSHSYRVTLTLLLLSVSPRCENSNMEASIWGRHGRVAHIGYGGIHCHLAARLRRRCVPQWRDGKLWVHLSSLRNTIDDYTIFFMPPHLNFDSNVKITAVIILSKHPKSKRRVVQLKPNLQFQSLQSAPI